MKPRPHPWLPAKYELHHINALQALAKGVASESEQKRALQWIINQAAETYDLSFRSDGDGGDRDTAFAEGRRFVGMQIVKLVNLPPALLGKLRETND